MINPSSKITISGSNRSSILDAGAPVFLRFGYRKASMDDIARAASLSRQSLYSHFDTKEGLFRAVVLHILDKTRSAAMTALDRTEGDLQERLLVVFEAMHGHVIGQIGAERMTELLETAASLLGPVFQELEDALIEKIVAQLATSGAAAAWNLMGISPQDLAQNLYSVSCGLRHRVATIGAYRKAMIVALTLVCGGPAKTEP